MPRGDKDKYTNKERRQERHIEKGYEDRGVSPKNSESPRLGDGEQSSRRRRKNMAVLDMGALKITRRCAKAVICPTVVRSYRHRGRQVSGGRAYLFPS